MFENIALGLNEIMSFSTLGLMLIGTFVGLVVGAMPGINGSMAMGILLPLTFSMTPIQGVVVISAIYCSATFGGSISAILLGIPGTISSMTTVFDGHPMAVKGKAGRALGIAILSSVFGGLFSALVLMLMTKPLAEQALKLGPSAYFALGILGLTSIVGLGGKNIYKGLLAALLGLLLSTIGIQPQTGAQRFVFGIHNLLQGIPFMSALIGLFGFTSIIKMAMDPLVSAKEKEKLPEFSNTWIGFKTIKKLIPSWLRGSVIGTIVGIIPGTGASIATFVAYDVEKKSSKNPEAFGTGVDEGIAAPESSNNGITGGSLVPLLALGIPGNSSAVFVLSALMIHGIRVGPHFLNENPALSYGLFVSLFLVNIIMAPMGLFVAKYMSKLLLLPKNLMLGIIAALCVLGTYSISNNIFDPLIALGFGVLGYIMHLSSIPTSPLILGLILGSMIESNFQQALVISRGKLNFLYTNPITAAILAIAILSLMQPYLSRSFKKWRSARK